MIQTSVGWWCFAKIRAVEQDAIDIMNDMIAAFAAPYSKYRTGKTIAAEPIFKLTLFVPFHWKVEKLLK